MATCNVASFIFIYIHQTFKSLNDEIEYNKSNLMNLKIY